MLKQNNGKDGKLRHIRGWSICIRLLAGYHATHAFSVQVIAAIKSISRKLLVRFLSKRHETNGSVKSREEPLVMVSQSSTISQREREQSFT